MGLLTLCLCPQLPPFIFPNWGLFIAQTASFQPPLMETFQSSPTHDSWGEPTFLMWLLVVAPLLPCTHPLLPPSPLLLTVMVFFSSISLWCNLNLLERDSGNWTSQASSPGWLPLKCSTFVAPWIILQGHLDLLSAIYGLNTLPPSFPGHPAHGFVLPLLSGDETRADQLL